MIQRDTDKGHTRSSLVLLVMGKRPAQESCKGKVTRGRAEELTWNVAALGLENLGVKKSVFRLSIAFLLSWLSAKT